MIKYKTSKDYEKLWELAQSGINVICLFKELDIEYSAILMKSRFNDNIIIRDYNDVYEVYETKEEFLEDCQKGEYMFLDPELATYNIKYVEQKKGIFSGLPVIKDSRFPLHRVFAEISDDYKLSEIADDYNIDEHVLSEIFNDIALKLEGGYIFHKPKEGEE